MRIPRIQEGIADLLSNIFIGPKQNENWPIEMMCQLKIDNPLIAGFLLEAAERYGEKASVVGMLVVKMIESQMEADELEEMFA